MTMKKLGLIISLVFGAFIAENSLSPVNAAAVRQDEKAQYKTKVVEAFKLIEAKNEDGLARIMSEQITLVRRCDKNFKNRAQKAVARYVIMWASTETGKLILSAENIAKVEIDSVKDVGKKDHSVKIKMGDTEFFLVFDVQGKVKDVMATEGVSLIDPIMSQFAGYYKDQHQGQTLPRKDWGAVELDAIDQFLDFISKK